MQNPKPHAIPLILVGIAGGILSGIFGIGGGTIIVPALALWLAMPHRLSAGTSVAAILPTALAGAISYAARGQIDWIAGALLAIGVVAGAWLGSRLLTRLPLAIIQWSFLVFLAVIIVSLWFVVPTRDSALQLHPLLALLLVVTGFITGILSGLLGVGGGVVVVPALMFFFGANDLTAKGTSLLMMIPGSISGTIGNLQRHNVDLRAAAYVGLTACACAPVGTFFASWLDPFWGNVAFSCYLAVIFTQLLVRQLRARSR